MPLESRSEDFVRLLNGTVKVCSSCLTTFMALTGQMYCSKRCTTRAHFGISGFKECEVCGGHFANTQGNNTRCEWHRRSVRYFKPDPPGVCANCTTTIDPKHEYCSPGCKGAVIRKRPWRFCVQCGLPWRLKVPNSKRLVCPECHSWRQPGDPPHEMSSGMRRAKRRQLAERDGDCCSCCGATEDLEIHHVRWREHGGTHALENLKLLCKDCHDGVHGRCASPPLPLAA